MRSKSTTVGASGDLLRKCVAVVRPDLLGWDQIDKSGVSLAAAEFTSARHRHLSAEHQNLYFDGKGGLAVGDCSSILLEVSQLQIEGERHRDDGNDSEFAMDAHVPRKFYRTWVRRLLEPVE